MASVAERIYELVKTLPESKAERVLGYVQGVIDDEEKPLPVTVEEHTAWCERLRKLEQANTGQADAAYSRYLAGQEKALSLNEGDYLPHLGRTEEDKTGSLLPSLKGFRQGLPLQSISAGEFCRAMREGERY